MSDSDTKSQDIEKLNALYREISRKTDVDLYMDIEGDKLILRRDSRKSDGDIQIEIHTHYSGDGFGTIGYFEWKETEGLLFSSIDKEEIGLMGEVEDWVWEGIVCPLENNEVPEDVLDGGDSDK